jgi:hypothetical protein
LGAYKYLLTYTLFMGYELFGMEHLTGNVCNIMLADGRGDMELGVLHQESLTGIDECFVHVRCDTVVRAFRPCMSVS